MGAVNMFGFESLSGTAHAATVVGLVLTEALVLYVGYGALNSTLGPAVIDAIGGEGR